MKLYEEIIYQHLLREFIEKAKALKKDYLFSGRNFLTIKILLASIAKRYIFKPVSIYNVIEECDKKLKE